MDGKMPGDYSKVGKTSPLERIMNAIKAGQKPDGNDVRSVRNRKLDNQTENYLRTKGVYL